jgi:uncharacterized protein (TIGR03437 family)
MVRTCILALIGSCTLLAQAPLIKAVRGSLSPGGLLTVTGSNFTLNSTVRIGGLIAPVLDWRVAGFLPEGSIEFQVPYELEPGDTTIEVASGELKSKPFPVTLARFAPVFRGLFFRAGTDQQMYSCDAGRTAAAGDLVAVEMSGLGLTNPRVATGQGGASPAPVTELKPVVFVGGIEAEIVESVLTAVPGVYRVVFKLPPGDGWLGVQVRIGGISGESANLPVGRGVLVFPSALYGAGTPSRISPELIATAVKCGGGGSIADSHAAGDPDRPGTSLAGVNIRIRDAAGVERQAPIYYAGPSQANFVIPAESAKGIAQVTITSSSGGSFPSRVEIESVAPGLYTTQAIEGRVPAGNVVRLRGGVQTFEPVTIYDPESGFQSSLVPIDLGPETDQVALTLYGSGFRNRSSLGNVRARIDGIDVPVTYAGRGGETLGLDQLNLSLPRSLAARGAVILELTVDGRQANPVYLRFGPSDAIQ